MQNKSSEFGDADRRIARIAKALSHPARVRILRLLAECGRCFTGTVVNELPLSQATVSQHLRELREAGLIRGEVEGPATCYCLDENALRAVSAEFGALFSGVCCSEQQAGTDHSRLKETVRARYGGIATGSGSCCGGPEVGAGAAPDEAFSMVTELYTPIKGYEPDADLGLGCGLPTRYAHLQAGETVIDLGSGAGNDAFVAAAEVGAEGRVIGIDMTPEMVERARELAARRGATNIQFVLGEIENMPIEDEVADCILSNCVLNLVPNKAAAFRESFRVLKPGGRFAVSDIVIEGDLPPQLRHSAEMYVGCVAGAMQREAYLSVIRAAGFVDIRVAAESTIHLPDSVLSSALNPDEIRSFRDSGARIVSVTVNASRPGLRPKHPGAP